MSTTSTEIDVAVDPQRAFLAFTDEYDQWWGNGPIDSYESWRLVERRIEPGVGGRLVEDYGDEQRVLGTITEWEPGARLAWNTPAGVTIEVTFAAHDGGTKVAVSAHVPDGVDGVADLSMVAMAPQWFPRHLARTAADEARPEVGRLNVVLRSATPAATARWLVEAFGLRPTGDLPTAEAPPERTWIELRAGNGFIVLWGDPDANEPGPDSPFVYVDDLDAHLDRAQRAGAVIVEPVVEHGFRAYTAADCEGRRWVFAQAGPRVGQ